MFNKRGQELSTGTIILLILGVIVLVVLALGFTGGWSKLAAFLTTSNVDSVVTQCATACSTESNYDYCKAPRTLVPSNSADKLNDVTCDYLADHFPSYGISTCDIDCDASVQLLTIGELKDVTDIKTNTKSLIDGKLKDYCTTNNEKVKGKLLQVFLENTKPRLLVSYQCLPN